ncbi:predicted protein [Naegleria gruberi]|uniref:Predicted protein n=1 Tax=Naegleria gruberi TaxID=5762 RepID=D2V4A2_NAEGR|nr:uncharacterized protein NAEGRDRAFT_78510 [Naegleria gruberi]EFC48481.1 predicted protein [Naegleria gruberi]|eukprot:XP_002681225.1 predicted protein [Naegleria gruberi strain NEG-M]
MDQEKVMAIVGLTKKDILNLTKSKSLSAKFITLVNEVQIPLEITSPQFNYQCGPLLVKLIQSTLPETSANRKTVATYIAKGKLKNSQQVEKAIKYASTKTKFDVKEFEKECGI